MNQMGSRDRCLGSGLPSLSMNIQAIEVKITVILILGITPSFGHGLNRGICSTLVVTCLADTEICLTANIYPSHRWDKGQCRMCSMTIGPSLGMIGNILAGIRHVFLKLLAPII